MRVTVRIGVVVLVFLLAAMLTGCASGRVVVATVNGEPIMASDIERSLGRLHSAETERRPGKVDLQEYLREAIDDRLMLQEARHIGLFEHPYAKSAVHDFLLRIAVKRLHAEEVVGKSKVPEEEIRKAFFARGDEAGVLFFKLDTAENAQEAVRMLKEGATAAECAKKFGLDEPKESFMRRHEA
ncbi:MAG: hypothetical protein V2A77_00395, partial [Pseudomonadota bacterium]